MLILPLLSYIVFEVPVSSVRHENEISGINFRKVEYNCLFYSFYNSNLEILSNLKKMYYKNGKLVQLKVNIITINSSCLFLQ